MSRRFQPRFGLQQSMTAKQDIKVDHFADQIMMVNLQTSEDFRPWNFSPRLNGRATIPKSVDIEQPRQNINILEREPESISSDGQVLTVTLIHGGRKGPDFF